MKTKEQKRMEAHARKRGWMELTPAEKLEDLDKRGHRANKQRERIRKEMG